MNRTILSLLVFSYQMMILNLMPVITITRREVGLHSVQYCRESLELLQLIEEGLPMVLGDSAIYEGPPFFRASFLKSASVIALLCTPQYGPWSVFCCMPQQMLG